MKQDQLAMANSVHWYDHVLRRGGLNEGVGGDVLRALDFMVGSQRKKQTVQNGTEETSAGRNHEGCLSGGGAL